MQAITIEYPTGKRLTAVDMAALGSELAMLWKRKDQVTKEYIRETDKLNQQISEIANRLAEEVEAEKDD